MPKETTGRLVGLEPRTFRLRVRRASLCATPPLLRWTHDKNVIMQFYRVISYLTNTYYIHHEMQHCTHHHQQQKHFTNMLSTNTHDGVAVCTIYICVFIWYILMTGGGTLAKRSTQLTWTHQQLNWSLLVIGMHVFIIVL